MKNIYISIFAVSMFMFSTQAQLVNDDFESYDLGDMGIQNPSVWSVWNGDPAMGGVLLVVEGNGGQVGYIVPSFVQDQQALLLLGNLTSDLYVLYFEMYVSAGSTAYFTIQGETETNVGTGYQGAGGGGTGVFNSGNIYFNNGGAAPGIVEDQTTGETGTYPEDAWFQVFINFDLNDSAYKIYVDGNSVNANWVPFQDDTTLGALHFYNLDAMNNYWIDNVLFDENLIGATDDFSPANFGLYPNPMQNVLNIRSVAIIENITIYDVLGKLVMENAPDAISPSIDMAALTSGVYLVKVTIGDASKTIKVIK